MTTCVHTYIGHKGIVMYVRTYVDYGGPPHFCSGVVLEGGVLSQSSRLEGHPDGAGEGDMEQEGGGLANVPQGSSTPQKHARQREGSAISIQLFAMDEMYEMRSVDFLPAIFELFPVSSLTHVPTQAHAHPKKAHISTWY